MITLTPHQQAAVDWLVRALTEDGKTLVALRGLAGTGKTSLLPELVRRLTEKGLPVRIGAPTHRAAMILRKKGLDADTIHSHALVPYFIPEYAACMRYFGEECPTHETLHEMPLADMDAPLEGDIPTLLAEAVQKRQVAISELWNRRRAYPAKRVLESVGIHGRDHFDGFGPKRGEGVLIIDEASMVGVETLALCQKAFPKIILVGDPGQLPPVKETAQLATVEGVDLTEIHRQAGDSPIVQLAYAAREGRADWRNLPTRIGELEEWVGVEAQQFLTAPLIVWRNKIRLCCTQAIRTALGYPADRVVPGEPLVCRANNPEDRADGFYNNALFRVLEVSASQPEIVILQEEGTENIHTIHAHVEELHGDMVHPRAVAFRFGYCLTAHTAQGGEWPTVYIAKPDLLAMLGACQARSIEEEGRQWTYTAITRAKQTLGFVLRYDFTQSLSLKGTVMPKMTAAIDANNTSDAGLPGIPEPDDIVDPVPPVSSAALVDLATPQGHATVAVDQVLYQVSQHAANVLNTMQNSWETTLRMLAPGPAGVQALTETLRDYKPLVPYSAKVNVTTPSGYPMSIQVQEVSHEAFLDRMGTIMAFLQEAGFTPGAPF